MKKLLLFLSFTFYVLFLSAQVSEGGTPPSFDNPELNTYSAPKVRELKVAVDIDKLKQEDALRNGKDVPSRVATIIPAKIDLAKDGEWGTLPDGRRICRLTINSPEAMGLVLYYSNFNIPYGAKLFIYDKYKIQVLGAYTNRTNIKGQDFATELVYGDELTLEYVSPQNIKTLPDIRISEIAYAYNNVDDYDTYIKNLPNITGFKKSGSCQVNVNCVEGHRWQLQKKGIARTYTKIGNSMYRCSGSLVNNTNNDKTAYYLSAYHCFYDKGNTADFNTILFYFNYEFAGCENEESIPLGTKTLVGAQLKVSSPINGGSDATLLLLNNTIPDDYDVYFNGWDLSQKPSKSGVCIHHPFGDVMKISTYTTPLKSTSYRDDFYTAAPDAHWSVSFSSTYNGYGTTEGGSSGSPLFGNNGLIVGTLSGGETACSNKKASDLFGKFYYHYDQHKNSNYHLKPFLNPSGTNISRLKGLANIAGSLPYLQIDDKDFKPVYAYWDDMGSTINNSMLVVRTKDSSNQLKRIRIINFRGYEVLDKKSGFAYDSYDEIDANGWPRGVYIVVVDTDSGRRTFKLMK